MQVVTDELLQLHDQTKDALEKYFMDSRISFGSITIEVATRGLSVVDIRVLIDGKEVLMVEIKTDAGGAPRAQLEVRQCVGHAVDALTTHKIHRS